MTRNPRFEAGSWVGICNSKSATVVGAILHRHTTAVVVASEQCRRVKALIVYEWPAETSAVVRVCLLKRTDRTDALSIGSGSEQHGMSLTVRASVNWLVKVLVSGVMRACSACTNEACLAQYADISPWASFALLVDACASCNSRFLLRSSMSSPQEEDAKQDQSKTS